MKRRRWKVRTHFCARTQLVKQAYGRKPDLEVCVDCGRVLNWRDVYPLGR